MGHERYISRAHQSNGICCPHPLSEVKQEEKPSIPVIATTSTYAPLSLWRLVKAFRALSFKNWRLDTRNHHYQYKLLSLQRGLREQADNLLQFDDQPSTKSWAATLRPLIRKFDRLLATIAVYSKEPQLTSATIKDINAMRERINSPETSAARPKKKPKRQR